MIEISASRQSEQTNLLSGIVSLCVPGVLALAYLWALLTLFGVRTKALDGALFIGAVAAVPLIATIIRLAVSPGSIVDLINRTACLSLIVLLALVPVVLHMAGGQDLFFYRAAAAVMGVVLVAHAATLAAIRWIPSMRASVSDMLDRVGAVPMLMSPVTLVWSVTIATVLLFRIEPSNGHFNLIFEFLAGRYFDPNVGRFGSLVAIVLAALFVAAAWRLGRTKLSPRAGTVALICAIAATVFFYFDYSLKSDAFHYLTNIGPALRLAHGGTLMVDTVSQYGPGPVVATIAAFKLAAPSIPVANIVVQAFNLAFFAVFLICLDRMTAHRVPALLLGFAMIGVVLAAWAGGDGVLSAAPSTLGFRYLLPLLAVLAISLLAECRHHSLFTLLVLAASAFWSVEALIGSAGVICGFLFFVNLHARRIGRFTIDGIISVLAIGAGLAALSIYTYVKAHELPQFSAYLRFLGIYNVVSGRWSGQVSPYFFGWLPMFLVGLVVFGEAWTRIVSPRRAVLGIDHRMLFWRFVPMMLLTTSMSTYYVARGVEFTLIEAFLPFCAIAIPGVLAFARDSRSDAAGVRGLSVIPAASAVWVIAFAMLALFRPGSPYGMWVNQCTRGICTPWALWSETAQVIRNNAGLDSVTEPWIKYWSDPLPVKEAYKLVNRYAASEPEIETLIGTVKNRDYAGDLVNLFAGKWYRWPRSMTFSDGINPVLTDRILAAPVKLRQGEIVIVRRDTTKLGPLESRIYERIKSEVSLCPLEAGVEVAAYRASYTGCGS